MSQNTTKLLLGCIAAILIACIICTVAFGLGFAAGVFARGDETAIAREIEIGPDEPLAPPARPQQLDAPANFDIFWEAVDRLENHFDGDVPAGDALTQAAITGVEQAAAACTAGGNRPGPQIDPPKAPRDAPANFDQFWDSVNLAYADCGDDVPPVDELAYRAIDGVIEALDDRYTGLLPPQRAEQFRIDLESSFEGIGATVNDAEGGGVLIVNPFPDSPAEQAGLQRFDVIIAVDGDDITELTLDEAVRLIRGPAGSKVVLTITREEVADPFDVKVTRARIDIPILESEITADNLLYVALFDFSGRSVDEMRAALQQGLDAGVDGIVLDLRHNPGGLLTASIDISSLFIEEGVIVSESGKRNFDHTASGNALVPDLPLAVLVDAGSASASEIVAGAVQDLGRGILVGETTFGKGSVQTLFNLSDGSLLRVTTARWFTPNGRQIDGQGLTPDIAVPLDEEAETDAQLDAAVDYLLNGTRP